MLGSHCTFWWFLIRSTAASSVIIFVFASIASSSRETIRSEFSYTMLGISNIRLELLHVCNYPEPCYGRVDLSKDILAGVGVFRLRVDDICQRNHSQTITAYVYQVLVIAYCSFGETSWELEAW